jgi:hypothetical protein
MRTINLVSHLPFPIIERLYFPEMTEKDHLAKGVKDRRLANETGDADDLHVLLRALVRRRRERLRHNYKKRRKEEGGTPVHWRERERGREKKIATRKMKRIYIYNPLNKITPQIDYFYHHNTSTPNTNYMSIIQT